MYAISNSQYELIKEALNDYVSNSHPATLAEYNFVRRVRVALRTLNNKRPFDKQELKNVTYDKG